MEENRKAEETKISSAKMDDYKEREETDLKIIGHIHTEWKAYESQQSSSQKWHRIRTNPSMLPLSKFLTNIRMLPLIISYLRITHEPY